MLREQMLASAGLDPERDRGARDRERGRRRARGLRRLADDPHRRRATSSRPAGEPVGLTCRVYRLRDGRVSPLPDPEDIRDALRRRRDGAREAMSAHATSRSATQAPPFELPDTEGRATRSSRRRRGRDRRLLDLQPLPLRARLARPAARGRPRLRAIAACASSRSTPTTPSAIRPTRSRRCASGSRRGGLAAPLPARREPGGRARLRRRDDPRRVRLRRASGGCATAARPTPTTRIPPRTPPGCARRSTPCSTGREPDAAETEPVGCTIKWKQ